MRRAHQAVPVTNSSTVEKKAIGFQPDKDWFTYVDMCSLLTGIGSDERLYPSERKQLLLFNVWRSDSWDPLRLQPSAAIRSQDGGQSDARSGRLPQCFGT